MIDVSKKILNFTGQTPSVACVTKPNRECPNDVEYNINVVAQLDEQPPGFLWNFKTEFPKNFFAHWSAWKLFRSETTTFGASIE